MNQETKNKISKSMSEKHMVRTPDHKQSMSTAMLNRSPREKSISALRSKLGKARKNCDWDMVEELECKISELEDAEYV